MHIDIHNTLHERAKTKKDGIYTYKGFVYVVKNGSFKAYADFTGSVSSVHGVFHSKIGNVSPNQRKEKLKELFLNTIT